MDVIVITKVQLIVLVSKIGLVWSHNDCSVQ